MKVLTRHDPDVGVGAFDSIAWAYEVHLKEPDPHTYKFAILHGNEDCPFRIQFWREEAPLYRHPPERDWRSVSGVVAMFDKALQVAKDETNYGNVTGYNVMVDAETAAFKAAADAGWDWESDQSYYGWALKATDVERLTEGRKRFLARHE